jgi:hypothetical protein
VTIFQKSEAAEPCFGEALKFERPDLSLFKTVQGLQQRAGVPARQLRRLAIKELVDNGLDNGGDVKIETLSDAEGAACVGGYAIVDDGPGIDPEDVPRLFSISRPMVSSKLLRLPTRGALGNGLGSSCNRATMRWSMLNFSMTKPKSPRPPRRDKD